LPVGISTLLQYSAPAFAALAAALFLGEGLTLRTVTALAITLLGISLVVHGQSPASAAATLSGRWELVGILGAILSGAAVTSIRRLRDTEGSVTIFAAFNAGGALVTAAPAWRSWIAPTPHTWLLICGVAAVSIISQLGMTWSLRWLTAAAGGLLMQLTPVGALAIGALAFGETIHPLAWLGAAVTIAGISLGALLARPSREAPAAPAAAPTLADRPGPLH
jgi:drug/metabolite transporter (DMT)-like permease